MKTIIKQSLLCGALVLSLSACTENSWNDHLDGFKAGSDLSDVQTIEYTLTAADYKAIADNATNKALAKANGVEAELAALATTQAFSDAIPAGTYVPAFITSTSFKYFSLTEGSAINLTYNEQKDAPAGIAKILGSTQYTVTEEDYQGVYGSDTDYAMAFSPSHPASASVPSILKGELQGAASGEYAIVTYNITPSDPVFGGGGSTPEEPAFEVTSVLGSATVGDSVKAGGIITAICARGFILTDNTGSLLIYWGSGYDNSYAVGDQVTVAGDVISYGTALEIDGSQATIAIKGKESTVTYPAAKTYTGAEMDAAVTRTDDSNAIYCSFVGTVSVSDKGYVNFTIAGAETAQGSLYQATDAQKALFEDGKTYQVEGYFVSVSSSRYFNVIAVSAKEVAANAKPAKTRRHVVSVASTTVNEIYYFNGSKWSLASDAIMLQASDYTDMGSTYGNLSGAQPDAFLPAYLKKAKPYAAEDSRMYVVYKYYNGSATNLDCRLYELKGSEWLNISGGVEETTNQFVCKANGWVLDPSVTLVLPVGKNEPLSTWFFQTCVDWIGANIPNGKEYITSYGNNEYYCGTSAYQGNIDIRPSAAVSQYPEGYAGMSDDQIVALMKKRFEEEVCPGALSVLYPNIAPADGVDVTVSLHYGVYTGTTTEHDAVYKVVGKAKFELVSITWPE